jgi:hypothetical protein
VFRQLDIRMTPLQGGNQGVTDGPVPGFDVTATSYAAGGAAGQTRSALPSRATGGELNSLPVRRQESRRDLASIKVPSSMLPDQMMTATLEERVRRTASEAPWSPGYSGVRSGLAEPSAEQLAVDQAFASLPALTTPESAVDLPADVRHDRGGSTLD